MSIEIGVPNNRYGKNPFIDAKKYESFNINSYKTPNVIQMNTDSLSFSNVYISYKNFKTGVDDTGFSIYKESLCLATFNSNVITTFQDAEFKGKFAIQDIVSVQSNINTNITFNLQHDDDVLNINSNNVPFFQINPNEINFSRDFKMSEGTLYVGRIEGPSANTPIILRNVQYEDANLDSVIATTRLAVQDEEISYSAIDTQTACLEVWKINNQRDYMKINSTAVFNGGQIMNINQYGNINIGKNEGNTESTINISKISPNIISYNGIKSGDIFKISENADISVGTTNHGAQLHIKRNDGEYIGDSTFYRKKPMIYLDMNYNANNNYSNIYPHKQGKINNESKPEYHFVEETHSLYLVNQEILDNPISIQHSLIDNDSLILKKPGVLIGTNSVVLTYLDSQPEQENFANFVENNLKDISLLYPTITNYSLKNNIEEDTYVSFAELDNSGGLLIRVPAYVFIDTEATNEKIIYQTCNIDLYTSDFNYGTSTLSCVFQLELNVQLDIPDINDINWEYDYKVLESTILPAPNFFTLDSNDNFISSISANGTLSLGKEVPQDRTDYLIYAPGKSHLETLNVSNFTTDNIDNIIFFDNANLSNINSIYARNTSIKHFTADNMSSSNAIFQNSFVNNLKFDEMSSDFLKYNNIYTNISNKLIVGELHSHITQNSLLEINVNDSRKGLIIQNNIAGIDPSLEIIGDQSKPMIKFTYMSDSTPPSISSMNMQYLNIQHLNGDDSFHFQIYSSESATPKILNYCSSDNVLAIGGNAICINYRSKDDYKITVGIRNPDSESSVSEQQYLHKDSIKQNKNSGEENVAIYGHLKIATEKNETLVETKIDQEGNGKIIFHTYNIFIKDGPLNSELSLSSYIRSIVSSSS